MQRAADALGLDAEGAVDVATVDASGLGPREARAQLGAGADLAAVAAAAPSRLEDGGDVVVADLGDLLAQVRTDRLDVTADRRAAAALATGAGGLLGGLLGAAAGAALARRPGRLRRAVAAFTLPLTVPCTVLWAVTLAELLRPVGWVADYAATVLGAAVLFAVVWVPVGLLLAVLAGVLAGRAGPGRPSRT